MTRLKLEIDLIPRNSWNANLRKHLTRSKWNKIRSEVLKSAENKCEICGSSWRLSCHEKWDYDKENKKQTLVGFGSICGMCHHVHHFGRSQQLANEGHLDIDAVIDHFCNVNGVSRKKFSVHKTEAFAIWRERSKCEFEWDVDFGKWEYLVNAT